MKRFAILGVLIVLGLSPGSSVRAQGGAPALTDSVGPVSFLVPPGWTRTVYPDGNVYASPMFNNGERCQITVFPMRHAPGGDLLQAALGTFRAMFPGRAPHGISQPEPTLWRGASPLGWDYAVVRKSIRGQVGEYGSLVSVILLIAQVDSELGVVAATSKDPQVSMCLGDVARSAWPGFFYGLRYTQAHSAAPESAWRQQLAGVWTSATGTVALRYAFTPAGRYADAGATQHRAPYWSSEGMVTTDAHFGNGRYTLQGNQIVLTPDSSGGVTRGFFRLEQESRDRGRTWADRCACCWRVSATSAISATGRGLGPPSGTDARPEARGGQGGAPYIAPSRAVATVTSRSRSASSRSPGRYHRQRSHRK